MSQNTIAYLQNDAFDSSGNLTFPTDNKPLLVMVKASWCGHCKTAAPGFQEFADKYSDKVICGCIREGDGQTPSEKELMGRLKDIMSSFRGFPHFVLYVDGKPVNGTVSDRSVAGYKDFISKYAQKSL